MIVASAFSEWFCRRVAAKLNGGDGFQGLTPLAINLCRVAAKENTIFRVPAKDNPVRRVAAIESIQSAIWRSYFVVLGVNWN